MVNCAVPSCKNDSRRQTKQNSNVTFHRFPKNEELLRKWVDAIRRPDWEPTIRSFVCSVHFADSSMYFSKSGLRKLIQDAAPEFALENVQQTPKKRTKRSKVKSSKSIVPALSRSHPADDTRKRRQHYSLDNVKREHVDVSLPARFKKDKADAYSPRAADCPVKRKLKKRIMNLTKLSKRRRLRCNALYASLNRIRKKVTGMTRSLKEFQQKVSDHKELSLALEACGVSAAELFHGIGRKERTYSPEPQEEEDFFYSEIPEIPNDIESYVDTRMAPKKQITIYTMSVAGGGAEPEVEVEVKREEACAEPAFVDMEAAGAGGDSMLSGADGLRGPFEARGGTKEV
ncbi:THAP domain-containing protein 1 [Operophtera brumata]|uniref:THAP domain-containing protein 1 n=1 Tax=Operophtera brumata TaxID=104452 RepID=A0A0L7LPE2_OPEBR|nr:THAP domain-containing protein 1 [Operophtera brumata]